MIPGNNTSIVGSAVSQVEMYLFDRITEANETFQTGNTETQPENATTIY